MGYSTNLFSALSAGLVWVWASLAFAQDQPQTRIQVQNLGQVEPFRVGATSGIPFTMPTRQWRGTSADSAAKLMSDLPEAGTSPLLNRLTASVLISPSNPPRGGEGNIKLASLRLASVYRLGQLEAVIDLAERSPGGLSDPENAAIATRAFLALGQENNACETAIQLQNGRDAVFWLKVRAFCLAREGRTAAAELTADLVLEADPEDVDFLLALNRMLNRDTTPASPINALELAMARNAGASIDLGAAPLSLISALAHSQSMDENLTRLEAARQMAAAGLLNRDDLSRLYLALPGLPVQNHAPEDLLSGEALSAEDTDAADLVIALSQKGAARAAMVFQSADHARSPGGKAKAVYEGLRLEKDYGGFFAAAQLYAPILETLSAGAISENDAMGLRFTYALLAAGRPSLAQTHAPNDGPALQRLFTVALGTEKKSPATLGDGKRAQKQGADLAYTDLMVLLALGARINDQQRNFLFSHIPDREEYASCPAGARAAIRDGARQKIRAASFLRAALMLADSGFDRVAPECGASVIRAFQTMGYDGLARQAAMEMMLAPRLVHLRAFNE